MSKPDRRFLHSRAGWIGVTVDDVHRAITAPPEQKPARVKVYSKKEIKRLERELQRKGQSR